MNNEERDLITKFVSRVGGAPTPSAFSGGSVPATQAPPLPPVDREADGLIAQMFQRYPEAPYRMTQLAFVQEQGLIQAQGRIQQLEAQLAQAQQAAQQASQQPQGGGGFFSNLFGGGRQQPPPPNQGPWGGRPGGPPPGYGQQQQPQYAQPPPQYAPGYQPGMFQRGGSGFLGSALTTAAGVAGGMVAGSMLTNMLSGNHGSGGFGGAAGGGLGAGAGVTQDTGTWGSGVPTTSDQDYVDNGSWDQQQPQQDTSWSDNSGGGGGGGWDSGGGGDGGSDDTF